MELFGDAMVYIHIFFPAILVVHKFATLPLLWHSQGHEVVGFTTQPEAASELQHFLVAQSPGVCLSGMNRMDPTKKPSAPSK
jgi:hypothetical protein